MEANSYSSHLVLSKSAVWTLKHTFPMWLAKEVVPLNACLSLPSPKAALLLHNMPLKIQKHNPTPNSDLLPLLLNQSSHGNTDLHGLLKVKSTKAVLDAEVVIAVPGRREVEGLRTVEGICINKHCSLWT